MSQFVVGDETGLLKLINLSTKQVTSYGKQSRSNGILSLQSFSSTFNQFSVLRKNGIFELWASCDNENEPIALKSSIESGLTDVSGSSSILGDNGDVIGGLVFSEVGSMCSIRYDVDNETMVRAELNPIDKQTEVCESLLGGKFLLGGKENDVKLFDLESQSIAWSAKNVPRDNLNLRIPVWITAIAPIDENTYYTGTAYKHLRFYDRRSSNQPIKSIEFSNDFRISSLKFSKVQNLLYTADTAGNADIYDPVQMRRMYTMRGSTGSIRDICLTKEHTMISTVGLDRHLRIYNPKNAKLVDEFYLKNRLNCCLSIDVDEDNDYDQVEGDDTSASGNESNDDSSTDFLQEMRDSDFE